MVAIDNIDKVVFVYILERDEIGSHEAMDETYVLLVRVSSLVTSFLFKSHIWIYTKVWQGLSQFKEDVAGTSMVILNPAAIATASKIFLGVMTVILLSSPTESVLAATGVVVTAST